MKRMFCIMLVLAVAVYSAVISFAAEHGGKEHAGMEHGSVEGTEHAGEEHAETEHGGKEHPGEGMAEPTANDIRQAMGDYVKEKSKETGTFDVYDPKTGNTRNLSLIKIHERVGKSGDYYYSCADFKDVDSGELLDLDLDVVHKNGKLNVIDVGIHKVNGKERYTYDENDNRIPVEE